ncbi:LacI family DNA-binding transcriptional regulator [Microbacterium sp. B2969]|uniref:LacI family DNA-binding transcriptional regulator n=1 Tax=Microbacterium alkaliflavum TaxID=3248839 RepID=A0ABW7Q5N7_9MICO
MASDAGADKARRKGGAATIYDVAELAGVSPSTVSRALGKPGRISAPTEARIRAAAEQLSFRINPMARALHTGRTSTLALVVADITNPVVFDIVRGAESAASAGGYTLVIAESQESSDAEAEAVQRLLPSVDGIILATSRLESDVIRELAAQKPVVLINRAVDGVAAILPDVEEGVAALLTHLHDLGHRSIAFLSGPATSWVSAQRWEHLLEETERRGMGLVEIGPNAPTIDGGREAFRRVRAAKVTAVVAFNDLIAIGLMQAMSSAGVRVPGQMSVAGFDDIFGSELIVPALTTVRSQLGLAGRRASSYLVSRLEDQDATSEEELLATELIVRGSTGPA